MKRPKELEAEHARFKKMYAEERIKAELRQEALEGKVRPSQRKKMAITAVEKYQVSIRLACQTFGISETCYSYQPKLSSENAEIADWLLRLTTANKRWGFELCFLYLRNVKHQPWNHKRVYRIYRELELNLCIRPKLRLLRDRPDPLSVPVAIN